MQKQLTVEALVLIKEIERALKPLFFREDKTANEIIMCIQILKGKQKGDLAFIGMLLYSKLDDMKKKQITPEQISNLIKSKRTHILLKTSECILAFKELAKHWRQLDGNKKVFN